MLRIREATRADAERAGRIVLEAYRTLPDYLAEPEYEVELADVAGRLPPVAEVLVAEDDGEVVGCATYVPDHLSPMAESMEPGEAGIRMLGVDAAAQGRGVGRLLVEACIERAQGRGRQAVFLHSTSYMHGAHRIYGRLGFRRAPERDWEPFPGLSLQAFRLPLDEPAGSGGRAEPAGSGGRAEPAGSGGRAEPAEPAGILGRPEDGDAPTA